MGTSRPASALFPASRQKVLGLLFGHPDREFYLRQIVQMLGLGVGHVQRELARLSRGGIVRTSRREHRVYYQADPGSPVFHALRALVLDLVGPAPVLAVALEPLRARLDVAFIFGSLARGEERPDSDVDLLVVGDVSFAEVVERIRPVEERLKRPVNPVVYPRKELESKLLLGNHFLTHVLEHEKLFVIGSPDELAALPRKRVDPTA